MTCKNSTASHVDTAMCRILTPSPQKTFSETSLTELHCIQINTRYLYLKRGSIVCRRYNRHQRWLLNFMMIAWDNGVASRLVIGTVHLTAFLQAKPVLETTSLV